MNHVTKTVMTFLVVLWVGAATSATSADIGLSGKSGAKGLSGVLGRWEMKTVLGENAIEATMTLSLKDGRLAGTWTSQGTDMEMLALTLSGDTLTFKRAIPGGQELNFKGTIKGNSISGHYTGPFGKLASTGSRKVAARPRADAPARSLLDGKEKTFLIVGYSTSYAWPDMLQDMLDQHTGGKHFYHVLNAVVGGSPVETWIAEPGSKDYKATIGTMLRDYFGPDARLRGDATPPSVVLCQTSLQFTRTQKGPIASITDEEGIRIGADAMEKLADRLHHVGIEKVFYGMHIYKHGYEPKVGNERFALKALLRRGHDYIFEGPDVWSLTIAEHPQAFTEDGLHPNERGMKIMAEAWYRTIAGADAQQSVIDQMHAHDYDINKMMRAYIASRKVTDGDKPKPKPKAKRSTKKPEPNYRGMLGAGNKKIKVVSGKTYVWAAGDPNSADSKWYDFTGAPMPPEKLQFGIGKDRIRAIDDPLFVSPDDPRLMDLPNSPYRRDERPKNNDEIMVIGYANGDDARAYPVGLLDRHELVNDRVGGKPVTVGW